MSEGSKGTKGMAGSGGRYASTLFWSAALLLALPAYLLRAYHLDLQILGGDEMHLIDLIAGTPMTRIPGTVRWGDASIPLALYGRALSNLVPLSEALLRLPVLVAGAALPVVVAAGARRLAGPVAALLSGAVVAVHPFFLFYGRFVRPYGIATMLLFAALVFVDRWHRGRGAGRRDLAAAVVLSVLATWFHLLSAVFVAALLASALARALLDPGFHGGGWDARGRLRRAAGALVLTGAAYGILVLAVFAPALGGIREQVLGGKVGGGSLDLHDVLRNGAVLAGFPGVAPLAVFAALALAGTWILARRDRFLTLFLVLTAGLHTALVLVLRPQLLQFSFVLARYVLDALPIVILLACTALAASMTAGEAALRRGGAGQAKRIAASAGMVAAVVLAAAAWFTLGPPASIYGWCNAWTHHNAYQTFQHLTAWPHGLWRREGRRGMKATVPEYYGSLGKERLILEWPPTRPFDENPYALYQWHHRRPMRLLAAAGEEPWSSPRLALRNVVVLGEGGGAGGGGDLGGASLVILHKNLPAEVHASLSMQPGEHSFEPYQTPGILASMSRRLAARCGPPVHEDRFLRVYRVPAP